MDTVEIRVKQQKYDMEICAAIPFKFTELVNIAVNTLIHYLVEIFHFPLKDAIQG
jgi:hypothetical protein